jgi:opacity protein-like surface antigen
MRKLLVLVGLILVAASCANAQEHPIVEVSADYQYVRNPSSINCHGFGANAAVNVNRWLGAVGDFGFCKVTKNLGSGNSVHETNYLFGPRVSFRNYGRVTPYAQFLLGGARSSVTLAGVSAGSQNSFAFTLGAGMDARLTPHFSFRVAQVEYLYTRFGSTGKQNNLRIQTGLVYRFGGK